MTITVRQLDFAFRPDFPILPDATDVRGSCELLGVCFTLPYLEPYLIRTMRMALKQISDPQLAEDVRRFSAQEGNHYRSHALVNDRIRERLSPSVAAEIRQIEQDLKSDYAQFSKTRSLRFNLGYAEGFEAMTLAFTLAGIGRNPESMDPQWRDLVEWHGAEEIEHRSVAFDAYANLYGGYAYRVYRSLWAQVHYVRYILRFMRAFQREFADVPAGTYNGNGYRTLPGYLRTFSPWYDPAKIRPSAYAQALLAKYDARLATAQTG